MERTEKLLLAVLALTVFLAGCRKEDAKDRTIDFPASLLREGDLVFRRGTSWTSQMVLAADKGGNYSHIGIVVLHEGAWKVVHAVPGEPDFEGDADRVKMESVLQFFSPERAKIGAVMRVNGDSLRNSRAARRAIALFQSGVLFDHHYNLSDTTRMYCTQLVAHVYRQEGVDLPEGRISPISIPGLSGNYLLPSDIQQSAMLCLIYSY